MMPLDPETLAVLLAAKKQIEGDYVQWEKTDGWRRNLEQCIEQNALPHAWDKIVAHLRKHGHAC